jgi:hypothetical protein
MPTSDSGNTPPPTGKGSSNDGDHPPHCNNRPFQWWILRRPAISLLGRGLWTSSLNHLVSVPVRRDTVMATSSTVPSTPNPETAVLIGTGVRAFLMIFGPILATYGITVTSSSTEAITAGIGTLVTLVGVIWSYWQKFQQAKLDHAGNVASARGGQAVKVIAQEGVPPV